MPRRTILLLIHLSTAALATLCLLLLPAGAEEPAEPPEVRWNDTSRDVYVDGELDPATVVLAVDRDQGIGSHLALLSERLEKIYVVDLESLDVGALPRSELAWTDSGATSSGTSQPEPAGRATKVPDRRSTHYLVSADDHTLLISPHQGPTGPIPAEELFAAAPAWQRRMAAYQPDADAVAALAAHEQDAQITVALGTWCGDSRNYVPKLLRSLELAANPRLQVDLVAIHRGFGEPADVVLGQSITNVPTVIVSRGGEEIGRIVETPAAETVEADLAAILGGTPEAHPGRWSREAEIARGRYVYRDAEEREVGSESWELYGSEGGGRLLHCTLERDGQEVDVWHRRDADGASEFAELTRRRGAELSRTRIWIDGGSLRSLTRGNATGIVEQHLEVPVDTGLLLPCAAEAGYEWIRVEQEPGVTESNVTGFTVAADQPASGRVSQLTVSSDGREFVTTPAGQFLAKRLAHQLDVDHGNVEARWWLDSKLGVPIRGRLEGQGEVTLEELTLAGD